MEISDLIDKSHRMAKEKGWWNPAKSTGELIALIHSELSEALEEYRNGHNLNEIYYSDEGKPEGFPVEIADAVIRIADMCGAYGIDLEITIAEKMYYNQTRSYRHGNKKL